MRKSHQKKSVYEWLHWLKCVGWGMLMLVFISLWQNKPWAITPEIIPLRLQSDLKHTFLRPLTDSKYKVGDFIFIDVSHNKTVVKDDNIGQEVVITDRKKLDSIFLQLINVGTYKFVLCDLIFKTNTSFDDTLRKTILKMKRCGFVNQAVGEIFEPGNVLREIPGGSASYTFLSSWYKLSNQIYKFPLYDINDHQTLPLIMYQEINHNIAIKKLNFVSLQGSLNLYTSQVPLDPEIRSFDLLKHNNWTRVFDADAFLLNLGNKDVFSAKNYLADKIIVVGDFENDHHDTVYGEMPGALLLVNTFISLENGNNELTIPWAISMLACFTILAHVLFYRVDSWFSKSYQWLRKWPEFFLDEAVSEFIINLIMIFFISTISYVVFSIPAEVFSLTIILTFFQVINDKFVNYLTYNNSHKRKVNFFIFFLNSFLKKKDNVPN